MRWILTLLLLINFAEAGGERYFIQLGSFKQLKVLEKSINALPSSLRSHVIVVRSNGWYIPFAYHTKRKEVLYSKVPAYKNYFPDASIHHSASMLSHPIVHNYVQPKRAYGYETLRASSRYPQPLPPQTYQTYQNVAISEEDNTLNLPVVLHSRATPPPPPPPPVVEYREVPPLVVAPTVSVAPPRQNDVREEMVSQRYKNFNKKMLSGHHYYLAYKSTNESPSLLIKVSFENHEVIYQPIMGDMQMTRANYLVDENKLYMFADGFTKNGAFSTLDEHRTDHFLVSSWANGKKLNTLRYYYKLNNAKAYLGMKTSNGLASTLEEGTFDDDFLEE